jgi:hypothetical protein
LSDNCDPVPEAKTAVPEVVGRPLDQLPAVFQVLLLVLTQVVWAWAAVDTRPPSQRAPAAATRRQQVVSM